tara:strand:+ start:1637 stop:2095 length:459 start_codon:yes stop_codon:yes gene_type:complete
MSKEQEKREKEWLEGISNAYPYAYQFFKLTDHDELPTVHDQVESWFKEEGYTIHVSVDSHRWTGAWYKDSLEPRVGNSEFYYGTGGRFEAFEYVATVVFKRLNEKYIPASGYDTFLEDISTSAIKRDKMKKFWSSPKGAEMRRKSINKKKNG